MLPNRFGVSTSTNLRKSRLEGKQSFLPKPRRPGSIDRLSVDARRPSNVRSSSAEAPRATIGGGRLSREASATKIPLNRRSRSQQGEAERRTYGQVHMTPLKPINFSTPQRTPSEDRSTRSWQASLERAIAAVAVKDSRPLQSQAWQRSQMVRVQEALRARSMDANCLLIRPLTITRFVDITGFLLAALFKDSKLNNDNYVGRLPHTAKRILYPGIVSKSWLRSVNTLHAFPHALALIAYLVDLVARVEAPVNDDNLYLQKDDLGFIRRDYLFKCWIRFQEPQSTYEDLDAMYFEHLKQILGDDEEKIAELEKVVNEQQLSLEDEEELAARSLEARRTEARAALLAQVRSARGGRGAARAAFDDAAAALRERLAAARALEADVERHTIESQTLKREVEEQPMNVVERTKLLEEVDYAHRVIDSKRTLAEQIYKLVLSKETELGLWQKKTLDSCVEYKQGLIHLSSAYPNMAQLAIDEKELMGENCGRLVSDAVEQLRATHSRLLQQHTQRERERHSLKRQQHHSLTELRTAASETRARLERAQKAAEAERAREAAEAAAGSRELASLRARREALAALGAAYGRVDAELHFWRAQDQGWQNKLASMRSTIEANREEAAQQLRTERAAREQLVLDAVQRWHHVLDQLSAH